jgi:hypothetical protein
MLEKNRAVYAKAGKELEAEGFFDDLAKILHPKPSKKTNERAVAAKKPGSRKVTVKKTSRRAAASRARISAGR